MSVYMQLCNSHFEKMTKQRFGFLCGDKFELRLRVVLYELHNADAYTCTGLFLFLYAKTSAYATPYTTTPNNAKHDNNSLIPSLHVSRAY